MLDTYLEDISLMAQTWCLGTYYYYVFIIYLIFNSVFSGFCSFGKGLFTL